MIQRYCSPSGGAHLPVLCKRERTMKVPETEGVEQSSDLLDCAPEGKVLNSMISHVQSSRTYSASAPHQSRKGASPISSDTRQRMAVQGGRWALR